MYRQLSSFSITILTNDCNYIAVPTLPTDQTRGERKRMPSCYTLVLVISITINCFFWNDAASLLDDWKHLDSEYHRAANIKRKIFDGLSISAESSSISPSSETHKYILSMQRHTIFGLQNDVLPDQNKERNTKVEPVSASSSYASLFETYETKSR